MIHRIEAATAASLALSVLLALPAGAQDGQTPAPATTPICGYDAATVNDLLLQLSQRPDIKLNSANDAYVNFEETSKRRMWSLTSPDNPAHPAAVCRTITDKDGEVSLLMEVKCEAPKARCDLLVDEFSRHSQKLLEQISEP